MSGARVCSPRLAREEGALFDCSWSLLNHGVAQRMRLNLGNLNPNYERELIKLYTLRWRVASEKAC